MDNMASASRMCSTALVVEDPAGLYLRPAAAIMQVASQFDADVSVEYERKHASGKNLLSMCMLAAQAGARLTISAVGRDARIAISAIEDSSMERPSLWRRRATRNAGPPVVCARRNLSSRPTPQAFPKLTPGTGQRVGQWLAIRRKVPPDEPYHPCALTPLCGL
jgi:phosphocarrier protein HPr